MSLEAPGAGTARAHGGAVAAADAVLDATADAVETLGALGGTDDGADDEAQRLVRAAGVVCWRPSTARGARPDGTAGIEVLIVHSARAGAWGWPKGKIEGGETLPECAVREVAEETGYDVVLGRPLPPVQYVLPDGRDKRVDYWAARVTGDPVNSPKGSAAPAEIDAAAWVSCEEAGRRLRYPSDLAPMDAALAFAAVRELDTHPLLVLRHGRARPRDGWSRADAERPLVASGTRQATQLAALLACWRPVRLLCSPWRRCLQTLAPYVAATGGRVRTKDGLSEAGHRRHPEKAARHVADLLGHTDAALLCTHRPVLPAVLHALHAAADPACAGAIPRADPYLAAGEVLVAHTVGHGGRSRHGGARIVAVERHLPA